jgi:hypothetical protein
MVRSLRANNHTLPSHLRLCSLFIASYGSQGLRWRYSNPPLSCLGNVSLNTFPKQWRIVADVVLYKFRVVSKEIRRLAFSRSPCFLHTSISSFDITLLDGRVKLSVYVILCEVMSELCISWDPWGMGGCKLPQLWKLILHGAPLQLFANRPGRWKVAALETKRQEQICNLTSGVI